MRFFEMKSGLIKRRKLPNGLSVGFNKSNEFIFLISSCNMYVLEFYYTYNPIAKFAKAFNIIIIEARIVGRPLSHLVNGI